MSDPQTTPHDDVQIFPPDKSLLLKIGLQNLDEIFTPQAIKAAEDIIRNSANEFVEEVQADIQTLETAFQNVIDSPSQTKMLTPIINAAFSITAAAGLAKYDLISALAKSLYLYCEPLNDQPVSAKTREVIAWHVTSIRKMLKLNITGTGGSMGETIMAELKKLAALRS
jgi:hypothetical protein